MAIKYAINGGGNWSGATWATASNQAVSDTTKPVVGDTATIDAYSGNVTVDAASACTILNCTGYTGILTLGANLTVSGSITLVSGMTFTPSTYTVTVNAASTITSGGKKFYDFTITYQTTSIALADDFYVTGTLIQPANVHFYASGAGNINLEGNFVQGAGGYTFQHTGSGKLIFNGTGTQSWTGASTSSTALTDCSIEINKSGGTLTLLQFIDIKASAARTFTHTNGTVDAGTSTLTISASNNWTFDVDNIDFYDVIVKQGTTNVTLSSDLNISHLLTQPANTHAYWNGAGNINVSGGFTQNTGAAYEFNMSGTGGLILDGTGTWTGGTEYLIANVTINTAGTITLSGTITFKTKTITYTAGTVDAGTSTLSIIGSCTLNTSGMSWYNISMGANIALTSNLTLTNNWTKTAGTLSGNYAVIFNGTSTLAGATSFYNLTINAGKTVHLTSTQTFAVTGTFNAIGTSGAGVITLDATTPESAAHFDVTTVGTVSYVTATDIDSATGSAIVDVGGTLLRTVNWSLPVTYGAQIIFISDN